MKFDYQIRGGSALEQQFKTAESKLRKNVKVVFASYGAQLVARAQGLAPQLSGKLARSVRTRTWENATSIRQYTKPRAWYAHLVERGVRAQTVQVGGYTRRTSSGTVRGKIGGVGRTRVLSQGIQFVRPHSRPFVMRAKPFMAPAWAATKGGLEEALKKAMVAALEAK